LAFRIQQGGGFIKQQQPGAADQGRGDGQPLLLAAAEAVDRPRRKAGQAHLGQGRFHRGLPRPLAFGQMEAEFTAAARQQQLMVWVLENQGWGDLA
jgi:hypothetical protein